MLDPDDSNVSSFVVEPVDDAVRASSCGSVAGQRSLEGLADGEATWSRRVTGSTVLGALHRKVAESSLADPDALTYVVCAREAVTRAQSVQVVTAADIFS